MAAGFEDILAKYHLSEGDLNCVCSKEHRDELTKRINDWKAVGAALGFTQEELDMIDSGFPDEEQKKTTLLFQWSMRDKKDATCLNLAKLLFAGGLLDLLQELCSLDGIKQDMQDSRKRGREQATEDETQTGRFYV